MRNRVMRSTDIDGLRPNAQAQLQARLIKARAQPAPSLTAIVSCSATLGGSDAGFWRFIPSPPKSRRTPPHQKARNTLRHEIAIRGR